MPRKRDSAEPKKMPRKRTAGEADLEDGYGKGPMASSVHGSWQGSWEQWLAQSRKRAASLLNGSWHRKMADLEAGKAGRSGSGQQSSVGQGSGEADLEDKGSLPPGYYVRELLRDYIPRTPELDFESPRDPRARTPERELVARVPVGGKGKDVARMSEVSQHLQQQQEQHQ